MTTIKRMDCNYDMEFLKQLWRLINTSKPKTIIDTDLVNDFKNIALETLLYFINWDNKLYNFSWLSTKYEFQRKPSFKAYICKGNNGKIVKTILKKRWWWTLVDKWNPEEWDFIWTQWLKPKVINGIYEGRFETIDAESKQNDGLQSDSEHRFRQTWVYSKLENNYHLTNKKNLFLNLKRYYNAQDKDPNNYIPMTYLISNGPQHSSFNEFIKETSKIADSKFSEL